MHSAMWLALSLVWSGVPYVSASKGTAFYYNAGLKAGACGRTNTASDFVVAMPNITFSAFAGATDDSNENPICKQRILVKYGGKSVAVDIAERCWNCTGNDIALSEAAFKVFAAPIVGRIEGVEWDYTSSNTGVISKRDNQPDQPTEFNKRSIYSRGWDSEATRDIARYPKRATIDDPAAPSYPHKFAKRALSSATSKRRQVLDKRSEQEHNTSSRRMARRRASQPQVSNPDVV